MNHTEIFSIQSETDFEQQALLVFNYQYKENLVYNEFCDYLNIRPEHVKNSNQIPFLPIQFFKTHKIVSGKHKVEQVFSSSGTTGSITSKHYVGQLAIYEESYLKAFQHFYGNPQEYVILALLPSYLEREGSSLIYMVDDLIKKSEHPESGFYLYNLQELVEKLKLLEHRKQKTLLIGVTFALLDLAEHYQIPVENTLIMETGGMKGRRKEMIREEVHALLKKSFQTPKIHSEYGMTELLSQAYSKGDGIFFTPPWMKVLTRDPEDALTAQKTGSTGGINIIDLANINSCAFIATQDLGKVYEDGSFEVLGRFDHSDIRGCNLMAL